MPTITDLSAMEILDSRGRPTVRVDCRLAGGAWVGASVPSGASTGAAEALELRDGDLARYRGLGCRKAVANVNGPIAQAIVGREIADQRELDRILVELDATPAKSRLGANAILGVSLAFARGCAARSDKPLYVHLAEMLEVKAATLPRLTINLFGGGKHAGGQVAIQDVLVVPVSADSVEKGLAMVWDVYQAAAELILHKYQMRALAADEGGLAPPFADSSAMLSDAVTAIEMAGYSTASDIVLAVDVAASHFYRNERYHLDQESLTSQQMIQHIGDWVGRYPIVSVEDGLSQDDWAAWPALRTAIGDRALVVGDDLLCTNPRRIARAVEARAANALLLKVNQIGTLSEAAEAGRAARAAGWMVTVSARSGETEDDWLADLAVGWQADQIKVGSITRSERLAKYNRLLAIEAQTRWPVVRWPA